MIELLVLYILLEEKSSIYGIKQKIDKQLSLFLKISFGSIHPALKKLEENKYISLKTQLSPGGQKRSTYSITEKGKEYFNRLILEDLPDNPALASQLIKIKIFALSNISPKIRDQVQKSILQYYEFQRVKAENLLTNPDYPLDEFQQRYIKHCIQTISLNIESVNKII